MHRALVLLALVGACAFDGSGTRAGLDDDEIEADAGRSGPSADPDPVRTPPPDAGPLDDDEGDDVGLPDAAPPDAPTDDDDDDEPCGGFGQACCEQGQACGPLMGCLGGTCL
jgi:hypothetical protein